MERRLTAILVADVVGYSKLMGENETGTLAALAELRGDLFESKVEARGGKIIKRMGDGWIIEYPNVSDAVANAIEIQTGLADHEMIKLRIGVHTGDVTFQEDDIYGDGINVAARLEALAAPGQVLISDIVHHSLDGKTNEKFGGGEPHELKNIARPVAIWRWPAGSEPTSAGVAKLALPDKPSIAVLPFDNMSGDPEQEYFSDGITEDIITDISRLPELMVISRNSTFTYKGKAAKVQDICRDLGAHYVLEGSVRKAGERVRITAQLIDGHTGGHLWADRYDRSLEDIFAVQDDVTAKIVQALEVELIGGQKALATREQMLDPEAYDCVLRGREQYRLFTKDSNAAAQELYEQAIELDPDYAEPYAGLAQTYVQEWFMGSEPTLDRVFEFAQLAADRDPDLPLVLEALGTAHLFNREHAEVITIMRRWIALEPSNADAYASLAGAMHYAGENHEVFALIEQAMRLNPIYPFFYPHYVGLAHMAMRHFEAAVPAFKRSIGRNPDVFWPHVFLAVCHGYLKADSQAAVELAEVRRINPDFSLTALPKLLPYKNRGDADLVLDGLRKAGFPE